MRARLSRAGRLLAAVTFATVLAWPAPVEPTAWADEIAPLPDEQILPTEASPLPVEEAAPPTGGPSDGIRVHGHWTFEIREPDGTLARVVEFENAFVGQQILNLFLSRKNTIGLWRVFLVGDACGTDAAGTGCILLESKSVQPANTTNFKTLTISTPSSGPNANKLVLQGTATAQRNGTITSVSSEVYQCPATSTPNAPCSDSSNNYVTFTNTNIDDVSLTDGQQVLVTVAISFS